MQRVLHALKYVEGAQPWLGVLLQSTVRLRDLEVVQLFLDASRYHNVDLSDASTMLSIFTGRVYLEGEEEDPTDEVQVALRALLRKHIPGYEDHMMKTAIQDAQGKGLDDPVMQFLKLLVLEGFQAELVLLEQTVARPILSRRMRLWLEER